MQVYLANPDKRTIKFIAGYNPIAAEKIAEIHEQLKKKSASRRNALNNRVLILGIKGIKYEKKVFA